LQPPPVTEERAVRIEVGRHQLCSRDNERCTLNRLRGSWSLQDRVIAETCPRSSNCFGGTREMERSLSVRPSRRLGFASRRYRGRKPIWGQAILRKYIRPVAHRIGIQKPFGWHTFRHSYSTLLRSVGTEFKVMQELLRHSSLRSTLDIYAQAISPAKHAPQAAVLALVFASDKNSTAVGKMQSNRERHTLENGSN
jgi:integrase